MIQSRIVKTLLRDITDATKLLSMKIYGVCSEAIESYYGRTYNHTCIKSGGCLTTIKASRVGSTPRGAPQTVGTRPS